MSSQPPIILFSTLAVQAALEDSILPSLGVDGADRLEITFAPTAVLLDRIVTDGARPDVLIATTAGINDLSDDDVLDRATATPVAIAGVGVAVRAGAATPDISTPAALRETLLNARSVAYSQTGASGLYFAQLLATLDIADEVNARATLIQQGFVASAVVEGRADLAVQQLSELMLIDGITIVGPLPEAVQHYTEFSVARSPGTLTRPFVTQVMSALTSPAARRAYQKSGLRLPGGEESE